MARNSIRQPVPTVERNVKFPSSRMVLGQFIVANVTVNADLHEDIKLTS